MRAGARTPEELETLLEDAFVLRDQGSLVQLFETGAVLVAGENPHEARGREAIARVASGRWESDRAYFADPRRVLQVGDTALVLAERAVNVVHRGNDGLWRYTISLLDLDTWPARQVTKGLDSSAGGAEA